MARTVIKAQMKQRIDSATRWAAVNPVLLQGELGIVSDDPNLYKVGDGVTPWNALPYRGFDGTIAHETGSSSNAVMSQKAVTLEFDKLEQRLRRTYITPDMYGAKGDGIQDDTNALREAVYASHSTGIMLLIPSGSNYFVTDSLNVRNGAVYDCELNMRGVCPDKCKGEYRVGQYGGITLANGASLFKNANISGGIQNVSICGNARTMDIKFFDNCILNSCTISNCNIAQFGAFLYNSAVRNLSRVQNNTMLTCYYFAKVQDFADIVDSTITGNYINGGAELNDNTCFEFSAYNGSYITNNFIDYYRTIYCPISKDAISSGQVNSANNHYQVFRYLYYLNSNIGSLAINSIGDAINWTLESSLDKLSQFIPLTYQGQDGKSYNLPPYVVRTGDFCICTIDNLSIEANVGNLLIYYDSLSNYDWKNSRLMIANPYQHIGKAYISEGGNSSYNAGTFRYKSVETNCMLRVTQLPNIDLGWSPLPVGAVVMYNDMVYTAKYVKVNGVLAVKWVDFYGEIVE